jgi:hypothetical protein
MVAAPTGAPERIVPAAVGDVSQPLDFHAHQPEQPPAGAGYAVGRLNRSTTPAALVVREPTARNGSWFEPKAARRRTR